MRIFAGLIGGNEQNPGAGGHKSVQTLTVIIDKSL